MPSEPSNSMLEQLSIFSAFTLLSYDSFPIISSYPLVFGTGTIDTTPWLPRLL